MPSNNYPYEPDIPDDFSILYTKKYNFVIDNLLTPLLWRVPLTVRRSVSQSENGSSILLRATKSSLKL